MRRGKHGKDGNISKALLIGAIAAIVASILLLVLFSVFMMIQNMPSGGGFYISFVIICLSAFCGGFMSAQIYRCKGLIIGALTGLVYMVLIALIGGAAGFAVNIFGTYLLKVLLAVIFGSIGGIVKINICRRC